MGADSTDGTGDPGPATVRDTAGDDGVVGDPAADLDGPVVLFDGVCNLCNGFVQFLVPRDTDGDLRFASLQSSAGERLLERCGLSSDEVEGYETIVLVDDGTCYTKSEAALRIAGYMDGSWAWLSGLRLVPRFVRDRVYDLVARYRYDVFGQREQCMLPSPETRGRFLDADEP